MRTLVWYHNNCADGFAAAWAAWRTFGAAAEYRAVSYGDPRLEVPKDTNLYILDFSVPRSRMLELIRQAEIEGTMLKVLDHHKTAREEIGDLGNWVHFDEGKSGAILAWEYFHAAPVPALLRYVDDRDRWQHKLPESKAMSAFIHCLPYDFGAWSEAVARLETAGPPSNTAPIWIEARAMRAQVEHQVAHIVGFARPAWVLGYKVPVVNTILHASDVGNALCEKFPEAPFSATYYDGKDDKRYWGLRSRGDFDVSVVAKLAGGGGHPGAAGFRTGLRNVAWARTGVPIQVLLEA